LYALRLALAAGLPLITALPLTRYLRGKAIWVALPLLVAITLLPILSVVNTGRDLWIGLVQQQVHSTGQIEWYFLYTQEGFGLIK
jgi:hypothetical protein